jgi:hypothetical protein
MDGYQGIIDSLVDGGFLTTDTFSFLDGGTVLYSRYPVVAGLLLWYDMGQAFVAGTDPMSIYRHTDPCHALIGDYMYAVHGGPNHNGYQYYNLEVMSNNLRIIYGDTLPSINCPEDLSTFRRLRYQADYLHDSVDTPEPFIVSKRTITPALRALNRGARDNFTEIRDSLVAISERYGHTDVSLAERYWFWTMFSGRTVDKLVANGVLERRGNGHFLFTVQP